jgi:hypothetical protein
MRSARRSATTPAFARSRPSHRRGNLLHHVFLSGGEIATQFLNAPPPRKVAAIVGGTGVYRGASGEAVIVEGPKQTGTITFRLTR